MIYIYYDVEVITHGRKSHFIISRLTNYDNYSIKITKLKIMKKGIILGFFSICIIFKAAGMLKAESYAENEMITLPVEVVVDKIRGGLLGQNVAVLNGMRHEMLYIDEPGDVKNYVPSLPDGAWTNDDTDFEWVYIYEMQKTRNAFLPTDAIAELWKERINRGIWCSNRFARHLMDLGFEPPYTGYSTFNPWADFNISGQFLCETFGLVAPGMPQTAARIGLNYTTVAINNEPAQTTQLFTTMIATAFIENDINKILDAGIATLDKNSIILEIINDIKYWHAQYPDNWRETRRLLKEKYTQEDGKIRDRNGHELNTGAIIAGLLYGNGDFAESVKLTYNFGWDADCTAATVGTILGVTNGYRRMMNQNADYTGRDKFRVEEWQIVDRYRNTSRDNMPMDETITSFADRVIELFEMVNEENGGTKIVVDNTVVYQIPIEQPATVIEISPVEEQKQLLLKEFEKQIIQGIASSDREERARAAYMAVCLDMSSSLARGNSKQWKAARNDLSGYWKVMNNIFFGDFQALIMFRKKFELAGFKVPAEQYSTSTPYDDTDFWKDPN